MDVEDGSSDLEVGNVRLLQDAVEFRAAFARFDDFSLNGWSEAKHKRIGAVGAITRIHEDRTCTIHFDDGTEERYPYEVVANQLTRWKSGNMRRHKAVEALRSMVRRIDEENDVDAFDMLALDPHAPHRPFAGNATRAAICAIIQICVPIGLGASITYRILYPDEYEGTQPLWRNFCDLQEAWKGQRLLLKLINKFVASVLLLYTYNFLETRTYHWKHKPTYELLTENRVFAVMEKPVWSAVGVITNGLALALCGFVNIVVIFFSDSVLDTVLNSLALFFIFDIDDLIVDVTDYEVLKNALKPILEASQADESMRVTVEIKRFGPILKFVSYLLVVAKICVLLSVPYVAVCKIGIPIDGNNVRGRA